jgi:hypothetical protein
MARAPQRRGLPRRFFPLPVPTVAAEQALVFACMCGQIKVVRLLLDRGVSVNANPPGSRWTATALHTARRFKDRPPVLRCSFSEAPTRR